MKRKYLPLLFCIIFAVSGCGKAASEISDESKDQEGASLEGSTEAEVVGAGADDTEVLIEKDFEETEESEDATLLPIGDWEDKWAAKYGKDDGISDEKFDKTLFEEKAVESKVDEAIKKSSSIADEIKDIEQIAFYYTCYHNASGLGQVDMNEYSCAETYTWEYEMQKLFDRILEETDASKKDSAKAEQDKWKADFNRCYEAFQCVEGSWKAMIDAQIQARLIKSHCYILAKELADIRGENYELPERFYRENSYVSDGAALDVAEGWEGGSISIIYAQKGKDRLELVAYDPLINENTISFKTSSVLQYGKEVDAYDVAVEGKITYGWDGATLTITKSGYKNLPAGTKVQFQKAM